MNSKSAHPHWSRKLVVVSISGLLLMTSACVKSAPDVSARLWEVSTGKLIQTFVGHNRPVTAVAFSPDGSKILTGSITVELRLWETATGKQIQNFQINGGGNKVTALVFSAEGQRFLMGRQSGPLTLRDVKTGEITQTFETQHGIGAALFTGNGQKVLAAASDDTSVTEWETATGKQMRAFAEKWWQGHNRVTLTADGKTRGWWDSETGASIPGEFQVPASFLGDGSGDKVVISPDGKRAFTISTSLVWARLWDLEAGKVIWFSREPPGNIFQIAFSPAGTQFVTGNQEGGARLWDAKTGAATRTFGAGKELFIILVFSPDGKTILTWGKDKMMRLWDAQTGRQTQSFSVPVVTCVTFSPDGTKILTGGTGEFRGL